MRFHVLGMGPVGQLVAHHLRRNLSPSHEITLMFKRPRVAEQIPQHSLQLEFEGSLLEANGFSAESTALGSPVELHKNALKILRKENKRISELQREHKRVPPLLTGHDSVPSIIPKSKETLQVIKKQLKLERTVEGIDILVVACKAQSVVSAIKNIRHRLSSKSTVVLLNNGNLASYDSLVQHVFPNPEGRPHFILASNTHGAWLKTPPFLIVHAGVGQIRFAIVPDGKRDFERSFWSSKREKPRLQIDDIAFRYNDPEADRYRSLRDTVSVLQQLSGLRPRWETYTDIQLLLRQKLVVNCVINPLTALIGCTNGELLKNPAARRLAFRICKEAAEVFRKEAINSAGPNTSLSDISIPPELTLTALLNECRRVANVTAPNTSSMLMDIRGGKAETEIHWLTGYLMTLGSRNGVETPVNASILDLVKLRTNTPIDLMM